MADEQYEVKVRLGDAEVEVHGANNDDQNDKGEHCLVLLAEPQPQLRDRRRLCQSRSCVLPEL
jgi:hypothetical protein